MYNPQSPTKLELRMYVITDSTNGYVCGLNSYCGVNNHKQFSSPRANIY
jgi:hypothetical protein